MKTTKQKKNMRQAFMGKSIRPSRDEVMDFLRGSINRAYEKMRKAGMLKSDPPARHANRMKTTQAEYEYPPATCMDCGEYCETWELIEQPTDPSGAEIWCYCRKCNIETFHGSLPQPASPTPI